MFSHLGKTRTPKHNLGIASLLSFVAGLVNVVGFFAVQKLTTNVTGHFAFFIDEIFQLNFSQGFAYLLYVLFFLLGSFVSSLLVEIINRKQEAYIYIIPTVTESIILFAVALLANEDSALRQRLEAFRTAQTEAARAMALPPAA